MSTKQSIALLQVSTSYLIAKDYGNPLQGSDTPSAPVEPSPPPEVEKTEADVSCWTSTNNIKISFLESHLGLYYKHFSIQTNM